MKIGNTRLIKRLKEYSQFNLVMVILSPLGIYFIVCVVELTTTHVSLSVLDFYFI